MSVVCAPVMKTSQMRSTWNSRLLDTSQKTKDRKLIEQNTIDNGEDFILNCKIVSLKDLFAIRPLIKND